MLLLLVEYFLKILIQPLPKYLFRQIKYFLTLFTNTRELLNMHSKNIYELKTLSFFLFSKDIKIIFSHLCRKYIHAKETVAYVVWHYPDTTRSTERAPRYQQSEGVAWGLGGRNRTLPKENTEVIVAEISHTVPLVLT